MTYKVVAFDLDGVLVKEPSVWLTLHEAFGTRDAARPNMPAYLDLGS